jgi:hypothetical protein
VLLMPPLMLPLGTAGSLPFPSMLTPHLSVILMVCYSVPSVCAWFPPSAPLATHEELVTRAKTRELLRYEREKGSPPHTSSRERWACASLHCFPEDLSCFCARGAEARNASADMIGASGSWLRTVLSYPSTPLHVRECLAVHRLRHIQVRPSSA